MTRSWFVGLVAFAIGFAGSWRPSFWYDEAATVYVTTRPWPSMLRLLSHQDAVHAVYDIGMHLWFRTFGVSELTARLPSALCVGIAAAGVVVLARMFGAPRVGVYAGLVFAVLPRTMWAATEARQFALTAAVAVWVSVVFVLASRRGGWWWLGYALGSFACIVVFLDLAALLVAHGVRALVWRSWAWLPAVFAGSSVALPMVLELRSQSGQVSWIPPIDRHLPRIVLEYQWFLGAPVFAVLAGAIVALGIWCAYRRRGAAPGAAVGAASDERGVAEYAAESVPGAPASAPSASTDQSRAAHARSARAVGSAPAARPGEERNLLLLAALWALLPPLLLIGYSVAIEPVYLDRYVTFTTPAVALLIGWAVTRIWFPPLALAALVAAAAPAWAAQRAQWAKPSGMDFSSVADYVAQHGRPGDCVIFANESDWNPASARVAKNLRPQAFAGLIDPGLGRDAGSEGWLWDENLPLSTIVDRLGVCTTLWYVGDADRDRPLTIRHTSNEVWHLEPRTFAASNDYSVLRGAGFALEHVARFNVSQVALLRKG